MHTGMTLIDLQKVLDTLDHKILIKKMTYLGFKTSAVTWFEFYLSSRKFCVSVDSIFSEAGILNCGVSAGSGMGLLLFLICINDLSQYVYFLSRQKHSQNWRCSNYRILNTLRMLRWWQVVNSFSERQKKTKCILSSKTKRLSKFNITYGNHNIKQ